MAPDDITYRAAIELLAAGEATIAEVAQLAGTSRQLVRHWAIRRGIDAPRSRARWLHKRWREHIKVARTV